MEKKEADEEVKPDPLTQLITCLSRAATKEQQGSLPEDTIYMSYAQIMGQVGQINQILKDTCAYSPIKSSSFNYKRHNCNVFEGLWTSICSFTVANEV